MRVGATLLLNKKKCYQSYGWRFFRPLGTLQTAMDSLDEYECDEVAIIRPVRGADSLALFKRDLDILRELDTMTPISFGGGLRSLEHLEVLEGLPIERLIFSSAFIAENRLLLENARKTFGKQAIQCLLPSAIIDGNIHVYNCHKANFSRLDSLDFTMINEIANEVIIYDVHNEGGQDTFDKTLIESLSVERNKLVITGGIGKSIIGWARLQGLASVLIDNKALHHESSIKGYKNA